MNQRQEKHSSKTERREFLKTAGAAGLGAVAAGWVTQVSTAAQPAAKKLILGVIGTGGMGSNHVRELAGRTDAEIAMLCDVDQQRLAAAAAAVQARSGKSPQTVGDMRRVFDNPAIDAVYIATPDHWHAPAAILALDAGKHVYVEKPCCHNIREGRLLADATKRSGKVLQVGTQSRSAPFLKEAMQRLHEGEIGDILVAKAWNSQRRGSIGKTQPSQPPAHLDFDGWVGPAPLVPYRSNLLPGIWRWWYDFGCGDIGNDGVHDIDVALWGFRPSGHPTRATCIGAKCFFDDDQQFPDTQYAVFEYAPEKPGGRPRQFIFEQRDWSPYVQEGYENGAAFYGTKGIMIVGHSVGWKMYAERMKLVAEATGSPGLSHHYDNFFGCIRGDLAAPNASAEIGHRAATLVHLANIAARTGRLLNFDPQTEQIVGDDESAALLRRKYRDGHWAVPKGV